MEAAWPSSNFFLGEWVDNQGRSVEVVQDEKSLWATFWKHGDKCMRDMPIVIDEWGRWKCGDGIFQVGYALNNYDQIRWRSEIDTRCWTWKRTQRALKLEAKREETPPATSKQQADSTHQADEKQQEAGFKQQAASEHQATQANSKQQAAFVPQAVRFCDENVPLLQLNEPQSVPLWALNSFPNSKPSIDEGLLQKILLDPAAVRKLSPVDAILHRCVDGRHALLCPDHRRLLLLRCVQAVHPNVAIKMMCMVRAVVETSFLGKWVDQDQGLMIVTVGKQVDSFVLCFERNGRRIHNIPLRLDSHGRWMCGKAMLLHQSTREQIVWQSASGRQWIWSRPEETLLVQRVMRFCETLPLMEASKEPVLVPVRALHFSKEKVSFGRNSMFDLNELMQGRSSVRELYPLDVFLDMRPDGKRGLYCRNNHHLLVLRCFQAMYENMYEDVLEVNCLIDSNVGDISPGRSGC